MLIELMNDDLKITIGNTALRPHSSDFTIAVLIALAAVSAVFIVVSEPIFLVFAFGCGLAAVAIVRFEWFFYAEIFLLPWYPLLDARLPMRDVFMILRFALLLGVLIIRKQRGQSLVQCFLAGKARKVILLFAAIATISLPVSRLGPNLEAVRSLARLFSYLAFFFAVSGWVETRQQMERIIKLVLSSGILVALFGFYQVLQDGYTDLYYYLYPLQQDALEDWSGRITSLLFHFNSLAGYLNLVLPLSLACMVLARRRGLRLAALACHSMALAALYFTGSRGGLIAYAVLLLVSLWFLKPRPVAIGQTLLALVLAAAIVLSLRPEILKESRLQDVDEFTSVTRLALWGAAGYMFLDHPVMGVGYGNYRSLYSDYIPGAEPGQLDAHNLYLQFLGETGVIGFLVFGFMILVLARTAIRLARNTDGLARMIGIAMGGALATTLTHGVVDYLFNTSPQFGALFWLLMALGVVASEGLTPENLATDEH